MKVGILSDTHSYMDEKITGYFEDCDEIWHAGDFGSVDVSDRLAQIKLLRGVYGNIDGNKIRAIHPESQVFVADGLTVAMIHIGGYPGRYSPKGRQLIIDNRPGLFISGHSHITKVIKDPKYNLLHINPGAAGIVGMHKIRTLILLEIHAGKMGNLQLVELGIRGTIIHN